MKPLREYPPMWTPDQVPTFERMQEELRRYNAGEIPEPEYDETLYRTFRGWQSQMLAERFNRLHLNKPPTT